MYEWAFICYEAGYVPSSTHCVADLGAHYSHVHTKARLRLHGLFHTTRVIHSLILNFQFSLSGSGLPIPLQPLTQFSWLYFHELSSFLYKGMSPNEVNQNNDQELYRCLLWLIPVYRWFYFWGNWNSGQIQNRRP
jgi:hypothetical protein